MHARYEQERTLLMAPASDRAAAGLLVAALIGIGSPMTAGATPGTITVANTNDSGPGSLRQAIADASPGETVVVP